MLNIAVEVGNYSVKFINFQIEKKTIKVINTEEILIDFEELDEEDFVAQWKVQLDAIKDYISKITVDYQLIISLPSDFVTTRFLSLPVKNKKKAHLLLPFQIEEDLPFALADCHWADRLKIEGELTHATVGIIKKELFDQFFAQIQHYSLMPTILTSDVSAYAQMIESHETEYEQTFCVIDIGHHLTKGFYFQDGLLVSNHQSYVAGKSITEAIAKSYDISDEEANLYKHQNSFFLLESQFDQVNKNQQEFAKIMDATIEPLINEIKRWDIGHRVKYGATVKTVYITGGCANIKNIKNYLSEKLGLPTKVYNPYNHFDSHRLDPDQKLRNKYASLSTLVAVMPKKSGLINYLKGDYVLNHRFGLPLKQFSFIFSRAIILSSLLSLYFILNFFIASSKYDTARKSSMGLLKNSVLSLKSSDRLKRPEDLLKLLESKNELVIQEVKSIQASMKVNALRHLQDVISFVRGRDVEIIYFTAIEDTSQAKAPSDLKHTIDFIVKAKELTELQAIEDNFKKSSREWQTNLDQNKLELSIKGLGVNL